MLRKLIRELRSRWGSLLTLVAIMAIGVGCFVGLSSIYYDMTPRVPGTTPRGAWRISPSTLNARRRPLCVK